MMNSHPSPQPAEQKPTLHRRSNRFLPFFFFIPAVIGFVDSSYLTIKRFQGVVPPCGILPGCDTVTLSKYSEIAGVPVALLGALFYVTILILSAAYFDGKRVQFLTYAAYLSVAGFAASLWFSFAQLFLIRAICVYCVLSAVTSTTIFIAGVVHLRRERSIRRTAASQ